MAKKLGKSGEFQLPLAGSELWAALDHVAPLLRRFVSLSGKGMVSLKVTFRGDNDYLAIAKRYNDDGVVEVCFGSGAEFVGSLLGLEVAMDQNKWRPDKWMNK